MKKICMFLATMSLIGGDRHRVRRIQQHGRNHGHRNRSRDRNLKRGGDKRQQPHGNGGCDDHHREHGIR